MLSPYAYGGAVILGLTILGASAGVSLLVNHEGAVSNGELIAVLAFAPFLSAIMGAQMFRRDMAGSTLVGGLAGALSVMAFFALPFLVLVQFGYDAPSPHVMTMFLGIAPMVSFAISSAGTLLLAGGVRRYRAEHGLKHAPSGSRAR